VRVRESAQKDQLRARPRLSTFLSRHGLRAPTGVKAWRAKYMEWVLRLRFDHHATEATHADLLGDVYHVEERIRRLEHAVDEAKNFPDGRAMDSHGRKPLREADVSMAPLPRCRQ
jgi:hypothetical protein